MLAISQENRDAPANMSVDDVAPNAFVGLVVDIFLLLWGFHFQTQLIHPLNTLHSQQFMA